jgi:hypothetical protein
VRRLARHLFTLCSAASLLLCVAVCALWVRSYFVVDGLSHSRERRASGAYSTHGRLLLDTMGDSDVPVWPGLAGWEPTHEPAGDAPQFIDMPQVNGRGALGFKHARITNDMGGGVVRAVTATAVPHWSVVLVLLPLPLAWAAAFRRRRYRNRHTLCPACGYDLRASPDRCPECGTLAAQ